MRAFVTGGHGFVGGWLCQHLAAEGDDVVAPEDVDVTDGDAIRAAVEAATPEVVYHLAALPHVGESWADPARTFHVNAVGTLHVLAAARAVSPMPKVLIVGSAEVYGKVHPDELPITEDHPVRPATPYAVSKVAAEYLAMQAFLGYGQPVISARAFNHAGPGQVPTFAVSDFARQVVEAQRSGGTALRVGNLSPRRDFTDVRDVVRAYRLLMTDGGAGEVYNVCSGEAVKIEDLARRMIGLAGVDLELEVDPALARPVDIPVLLGDPSKLQKATGWAPEIPLDDTLRDTLEHWRAELG